MMKLEFEQVLEYVRGGEKDPGIEKLLQIDPNGPAMLSEARLIYEVLGEQPEPLKPPAARRPRVMRSAAFDAPTRDLQAAAEPEFAGSSSNTDLFGDDQSGQFTPSDAKSLSRLASRAAGPRRELGELRIGRGERTASLSYEPRPRPPQKRRPELADEAADVMTFYQSARPPVPAEGIEIKGYGLTIKLPEDVPADGPLRFRITDTRLRAPARDLELIFMPEIGPFAKGRTDSKGVAEFEIPEQSGLLRISGEPPQVLHILVEKK